MTEAAPSSSLPEYKDMNAGNCGESGHFKRKAPRLLTLAFLHTPSYIYTSTGPCRTRDTVYLSESSVKVAQLSLAEKQESFSFELETH